MNSLNPILCKLNFIISLLYFVGIVIVIFFAWGYGDDYFILNRINDKSILKSMVYFYNNWDGRQLSPGGFIHFLSFKYLSINMGIAFIFICWIFFIYATLITLNFNFYRKDFVIISALFFIGLFPFYKDILFWKTGGFYVYFLIQALGIIWIYKNRIIKNSIFEFFVIFLLSLNSINIIVPIFIYFLIIIIWKFFKLGINSYRRDIYYSMAIFIGFLVVSISPGNGLRMESEGIVFLSVIDGIMNLPIIFYQGLNYSKYSFFLGVLAASFINSSMISSKYTNLKFFVLIFIIALFSIMPFMFTPTLARVRVFFSVATLLFFSGCYLGFLFKKVVSDYLIKVFTFACLLTGFYILFLQIKILVPHSKVIKDRELFLYSNYNSNEDIVYNKVVKPEKLFIIRSPDYNIEWNSDLVKYFKINSYLEE